MLVPLDETPDETRARLLPLAERELSEALEAGGIAATAVDGSLGSGKLWPSSDLDLTVVPDEGPEWGVEWGVRNGIVVHKHLNRWPLLERLQRDFPRSFVDTAAGDWVRDPTWLLDGLATLRPVHDPDGRLQAFADWVRAHRFAPEVVLPRRPLFLRRAVKLRNEVAQAFETGDETGGAWWTELASESLALIWLEADGRIVSTKEIDPELAAACANIGADGDTHALFRQAAGVGTLTDDRLRDITAAFERLLRAFSDRLDLLIADYPTGQQERDFALARLAYYRHRVWSALHAPERGCLLHLAAIRLFVEKVSVPNLGKYAVNSAGADADAGARLLTDAGIATAREQALKAFPLGPTAARLTSLDELIARTRRTFAIEEPS